MFANVCYLDDRELDRRRSIRRQQPWWRRSWCKLWNRRYKQQTLVLCGRYRGILLHSCETLRNNMLYARSLPLLCVWLLSLPSLQKTLPVYMLFIIRVTSTALHYRNVFIFRSAVRESSTCITMCERPSKTSGLQGKLVPYPSTIQCVSAGQCLPGWRDRQSVWKIK